MTELRKKRLLLLATKPIDHKAWYSQYYILMQEGLVGWAMGFAYLTPKGEQYLTRINKC